MMDVLNLRYLDNLKRYWRRRKYHRLDDGIKMKRKLKIVRLGNKNDQKELKIKKGHNLEFKIMTPCELVSKLHEAYVDAMVRLGGSKRIDRVKNEAKRVAKCQPIPMLSAPTDEMVDSRAVINIYNRMVSIRQVQSALIPEFY